MSVSKIFTPSHELLYDLHHVAFSPKKNPLSQSVFSSILLDPYHINAFKQFNYNICTTVMPTSFLFTLHSPENLILTKPAMITTGSDAVDCSVS